MKDPIVVRINKFLTRDDFRKEAEKFKRDNPNIIVLPAEYELLYPDVIPVTRCKDCLWHYGTICRRNNTMFWEDEDFCSLAERKEDGTI